MPSQPGAPSLIDWTKPDLDIFTTNVSIRGWCNVDPAEAYASKVHFKEECDCKYDGLWGRFCETPVESVCINQCSGNGQCRGGFCQVELSITFYIISLVDSHRYLIISKLLLLSAEIELQTLCCLNMCVGLYTYLYVFLFM